MSLSVVYALRRDEVWHWYKTAWKRNLWPFHLLVVAAAILPMVALGKDGSIGERFLTGLVAGLSFCVVIVAYPQIRFRSQERTLTVDDAGVRSVRGRSDYSVAWKKIARIEDDDGYLIITERKRNAFIIPTRAFASDAERMEFLKFVAARIAEPN